MKVKIITDNSPEYESRANHPMQSWLWGQARQEMGIEVLRTGEYDGKGKLTNVFQLTFHNIPYTKYKIGYLPRSIIPSKEKINLLHGYGRLNKIIFIKIEPYVINNNKLQIADYEFIKKSPHPLFTEWTQIIDLTLPEEELLNKMHHKTRYNIRLAQKKGVSIREMSDEKGFKIFSKLYFDTCQRQKYFGHTNRYHQIIWENLKNQVAHILIAFYQNTPLAAYELFFQKDVFYYPYGGSSTEYRNFMAANLLMWEAIKLGKKLGAVKFDMWGSLPPNYDQNNDWAGFTRFKEGYGGKFVQMVGSYDLIVNPALYKIYNALYLGRQFYLKLKKGI